MPLRFIIFTLFLALGAQAAEWKLVKHAGRDHVSWENMGEFYQLGPVVRKGRQLELKAGSRSLRGEIGSKELLINNLKFILSYPVIEVGGQALLSRMDLSKLIEPVLRPNRIKNTEPIDTVVLDAGHGGHDQGATNSFGAEKNYTLDVAKRAKGLLESQGYHVVMTRANDVFIPLDDRVRIANAHDRAVFISIHFNHGGEGTGLETYTLAPRGVPSMAADGPRMSDLNPCTGNARDPENMALATATHAAMVCRGHLFDRGIKRARFVVIRDIAIPGVLLEGGFLSNPHDSRKVATNAYRQEMASGITQAVENYKRAVTREPLPAIAEGPAPTVQLNPVSAPKRSTALLDEPAQPAGN